MDADVVCISDDDEQREEETSKSLKTATNKMRNLGFHYNVYENSYYVPESARIQLELLQKQKEQQQQQQQRQQQQQQTKDVPKEVVVYVPDDGEEEVLLIGPIRKFARQILFGDKLCSPPTEFPYSILLQLEQHLAKSLRNVSSTTETSVWNYTIEQLSCFKIAYCGLIDLKADPKFNLIVIRILSQYVNFRSRLTAANKSLVKDQIKEICKEIWLQLEILLSNNFMYIIMVLLRTDAKDYPLDVVLYPLFEKAHELMLRGRHKRQSFPEILLFILTVLFYKHWQLMFTEREDRRKHIGVAKLSITKYFQKMPENVEKKYEGFIRRVDDRIHHSSLYKTTAYQLFGCKFEVTKAINNFFREYDWFVFVFVDCDPKGEKVTASSRAHSLIAGTTYHRTPINKQLNQHQPQLQQQKAKAATATMVRSSPSPAPSSNSACFSSSLFTSSTSKMLVSATPPPDNNNRLKSSSNFKNVIVGGHDDDGDSDDIMIIDAHDTESTSTATTTTNGATAINNFDENANFSSATSPLTRSHGDDSTSSPRQLPLNRARLKSNADIQKDNLNFSNFDDSKHASSSGSFRRLFNNNSVSDGELVTESSTTLIIDEHRSQAEQIAADTTSVNPPTDLPAITNKLNGLRCSTDIKVSSSETVVSEPPIIVDVEMEPVKSTAVTSSELPPNKLLKCVPSSKLFDKVDVAPKPSASSSDRSKSTLPETSRTQSQTNSKAIEEPETLIIDDSMSPCSLDDFGATSELPSKSASAMGTQRVFNSVPTYDDAVVLKYRSVSPYFEQEHQKEQQKTSASKPSICDPQEKSAPQEAMKTQSVEAVSSSTSATIEKELESQRQSIMFCSRSTRSYSKRSDSNDQVPTISSNENFVSTALVDSGIASPADEAISKDTLINVPTSTMADDCLPSTSKFDEVSEIETPLATTATVASIVPPKNKEDDTSLTAMSTPFKPKPVLAKLPNHVASASDDDQELFKSSPFRIRVKRHKSLLAATSAEVNLNDGYENFLHGLFCDTKTLQKNVSFKTAFASKRVNGFRAEKIAEPKASELPVVGVEHEKGASATTTATEEATTPTTEVVTSKIDDISSTTLEKSDKESESTVVIDAQPVLPANESEMEVEVSETELKSTANEEVSVEETAPTIIAAEAVVTSFESKDETELEPAAPAPELIEEEIETETQPKCVEITDEPMVCDEPVVCDEPLVSNTIIESSEQSCELEVALASPQRETPETVVEEVASQQTPDDEPVVAAVAVEEEIASQQTPDDEPVVAAVAVEEEIASQQTSDDKSVVVSVVVEDEIASLAVEQMETSIPENNEPQEKMETEIAPTSTEPETLETNVVENPIEQIDEQEVELQQKIDDIPEVGISTDQQIQKTADVEELIQTETIETVTTEPETDQKDICEPQPVTETDIESTEKHDDMVIASDFPEHSLPETNTAQEIENEMHSKTDEILDSDVSINEQIPMETTVGEAIVTETEQKIDEIVESSEQETDQKVICEQQLVTETSIESTEKHDEMVIASDLPEHDLPETNTAQEIETEMELHSKTDEILDADVSIEQQIPMETIVEEAIVTETVHEIDEIVESDKSTEQEELPETHIESTEKHVEIEVAPISESETVETTDEQEIIKEAGQESVQEVGQKAVQEIVSDIVREDAREEHDIVQVVTSDVVPDIVSDIVRDDAREEQVIVQEIIVQEVIVQEVVTDIVRKSDEISEEVVQVAIQEVVSDVVREDTREEQEIVQEVIPAVELQRKSDEISEEMEVTPISPQPELTEKAIDEEIELPTKIDESKEAHIASHQEEPAAKIDAEIETSLKPVDTENDTVSVEKETPEQTIAEEKVESEMVLTTIDIAETIVEDSQEQTTVAEEQPASPEEVEMDFNDETTCDEIPDGPIEIDECTQAIPSPADEAFTAPLVDNLEEINAAADKIRVEFESTKSVAQFDSTVDNDDEVMLEPETYSSVMVSESIAEEVPVKIVAEQDRQLIEKANELPPQDENASDSVISVASETCEEETLVTCSTSGVKSSGKEKTTETDQPTEDIILIDIVCQSKATEETEAEETAELEEMRVLDTRESNSLPKDEQSTETIIPEEIILPQETITDPTTEATPTESEAAVEPIDEMPIVASLKRMEITCDEEPTSTKPQKSDEHEKEIPSTITSDSTKTVENAPLRSTHRRKEKKMKTSKRSTRKVEITEPQSVMPVEPVAIFAAKHFEIQEYAIDFSLKASVPVEIIPTDAELPTEPAMENENQIVSELEQNEIVASPKESRTESLPIPIENELPIVEPAAIPETNQSEPENSTNTVEIIPLVNVPPAEPDVKPKVEKKSSKSGRRTKPTKMVKVNHLNENTLREICEKTTDNPLIDNLNVLVEVALADQIKNMPGVSLTVKSIQEIDEIAQIPLPTVTITPSTMSSIEQSKPVSESVSIVPVEPEETVAPAPSSPVKQPVTVAQKKEEPAKKRWEKAENGVRKSARIKTKEKKNELFEEMFEDVDRALLKIRKMTEKRKATIFRAVDTIKEISPYKEQPQQPVVVEERKTKSTETYVQKPVREKTIKSFKLRSNSKSRDAKTSKTATLAEKKQYSPVIEKASVASPPLAPPPTTPSEEKSGPEILTALNLTAKKVTSKRSSSELDSVAPMPSSDEPQAVDETQQQSKKLKSSEDAEVTSVDVEAPVEPIIPTKVDEVLRTADNSSSSCAKTLFSTPTKDNKNRLTNGHSGSSAAVVGDSSPCAKRAIENDENKYMSPLVMKKTFECKCNSDRDRILKRLKEFDKVFQPISNDDNAICLITETIPNDYMETRTTLIKIKKIFFQRFVSVMQQKYLGVPHYLTQMQQQLLGLSQNVSIDNKIFDDVIEWYGNMKDEMRTKNTHTVESLELFSNFDRFLKWWRRKFKCYCTPIQNKKCSKKFYDTEESISSDSNSQDRNYSPAKGSPTNKLAKKIDEMAVCASPKLFADFVVPSDVDETQNMICETPPDIVPTQEPIAVVPDSIEAPATSESSSLPSIEPASEPTLPIDAANTIISFPNLFVSDSTDIEITTADTVKKPVADDGVERTSPMYESEDSLLMLPSIDAPMGCDTMNFPDQLAQLDLQSENAFDAKSLTMSMYMDQAITIPLLPDVKNDALVSSTPQKLNEIMLQNEIDNYGDDNKIFDNIFGDFKREYVHRTDPTMGPSKKGYAERPLPVEEAVFPLVDNDLTRISSLSNGHNICAPLKEILDPSRIPKKSFAENVAFEDHTQSNQVGNCNGNENAFDNSFDSAYNQDLSDTMDYYDDNMFYLDMLISNTSQNSIENVTNDVSAETGVNQSMDECGKEQVLDEETIPAANAENEHHESQNQHPNRSVAEKSTISGDQTADNMGYEQTKMNFDDIIEYDPEVTATERCDEIIENMEFLKSDYELKTMLPVKASTPPPPPPPALQPPPPPPKKSTNDDFPFKQPTLYPNGPTTKTHSSKHSSKSHKSKRKHHHDDSEAPSKKQHKFDELKESTTSSASPSSSSSSSSHRDSSSGGSGSSSSNSSHHHKKSSHHVPTYIVKNISYVKSQSQSLSRSNHIENGEAKITRSSHHHNGTDKNSNTDLSTPKIIKIKIKNLPPDDPTKGQSQNMSSSSRRDSKKYHHSVSSSKYEEAPKKSHHSSSRKSSSSSRSLPKSNQHWRAQVHFN